jgi:5-methyltetrahydropteroyltriglutamate--homocysteine methyltransferase
MTAALTFRTDLVGSLVRPPELLDTRDAFKADTIDARQLREAEDSAILETLELLHGVGAEIFTDGEMRRDGYQTALSQSVDGFAEEYPTRQVPWPDGSTRTVVHHTKRVVGKLRPQKRLSSVEALFMAEHAPGPFKITLPSPAGMSKRSYGPETQAAYPERAALTADLVGIIRDESVALADEGAAYIQLDEGFVDYVTEDFAAHLRDHEAASEASLLADIDAENSVWDALEGRGVTRAMHLCRGNRTPYMGGRGGSYDWLAERLFSRLNVDRLLLEYDSEQKAGSFAPLRFMPSGKIAVLGLVSTKLPALESEEELLRRIDEASQFLPLEQLALSPQCGFHCAADRDGAFMSIDEERRKLELIARVAQRVWG